VSSSVAELQVVLEGVPLPAGKQELVEHARREEAGPHLLSLLEALPDREYRSLDEVGETLEPVQPERSGPEHAPPQPESGLPPGGEAYTGPAVEPGAVRDP
jgi:Protein of unknown function (DUF2795)